MSDIDSKRINLKIKINNQYHIGSGFGLGRIIDSLLKVDEDGVPVLPGSTVIGIIAQGLFDLLRFEYFKDEWDKICDYHKPGSNGVRLSCSIIGKDIEDSCLLCYFFGSTAQEGVLQCQDFRCRSDETILRPMLKSGEYSMDERRQIIKESASHRQNIRTRTVQEKHLFVKEEGRSLLVFEGSIEFAGNVDEAKLCYIASAIKNVNAVGQRKTRGKGACTMECSGIDAKIRGLK